MSWFRQFLHRDSGQDLAEYCLITALVALVALGIFYRASGGMKDLWGNANSTLITGNSASGATGTGTTGAGSEPRH
jgi:Flp pilus assembly pilin Flp